ncbi:hypothetical protein BDN72DRAFT_843869 [Pluteus cervinus]|uniref:Uncharacterized protein n=1 Tax=Pluteus cervinus TaxID=181527 RepID=A0ACD3ALV7_9AGAR|nr:hypothetical protein BDN72DRAFT_843869 [Pluteus cervinus]
MNILGLQSLTPSLLSLLSIVLLLVCTFGAPFSNGIWLFSLRINTSDGVHDARYGLFGYCVPSVKFCSKPTLGYIINDSIATAFRAPGLQQALSSTLTKFLILVPIGCGVSIVMLLVVGGIYLSKKNLLKGGMSCFPMTYRYARGLDAMVGLAFFITGVAFVVELAVAGILSSKVKAQKNPNLKMVWGNIIYLTAIALFGITWNYVLIFLFKKDIRDEIVKNCYYGAIHKPQYTAPNTESQFLGPVPPAPSPPVTQYPHPTQPQSLPSSNPQYGQYPDPQFTGSPGPQYSTIGSPYPPQDPSYATTAPNPQYPTPNPQYPNTNQYPNTYQHPNANQYPTPHGSPAPYQY